MKFKLNWHDGRLIIMAYTCAHARFDNLDLDARSYYIVGRQRHKLSVELYRQLSKQQVLNLLCTSNNGMPFLRDRNFENVPMA